MAQRSRDHDLGPIVLISSAWPAVAGSPPHCPQAYRFRLSLLRARSVSDFDTRFVLPRLNPKWLQSSASSPHLPATNLSAFGSGFARLGFRISDFHPRRAAQAWFSRSLREHLEFPNGRRPRGPENVQAHETGLNRRETRGEAGARLGSFVGDFPFVLGAEPILKMELGEPRLELSDHQTRDGGGLGQSYSCFLPLGPSPQAPSNQTSSMGP